MVKGRGLFQAVQMMAGVAGLLAAEAPALAQTTVREIVVESPKVVRETIGHSSSGAREEQISLSHRITYSDLDLSRTADVEVLRTRVRDAAKLGCDQLQNIYPLAPHDPECVRKAIKRATPQLRLAMGAR